MDEPMRPWPRTARAPTGPPRVGVVAVNYNTAPLITRLLFGLRCVLNAGLVAQTVIVDNASTDGSRPLLAALREAVLVDVLFNDQQRYHGPALTQGVNHLAALQTGDVVDLDLVWVLDTDVFILRPDTLEAAAAALIGAGAVLAGEPDDGEAADPHLGSGPVALHSLLTDVATVWQPRHRPFLEDGDPSRHLQQDVAAEGHRTLLFPFRSQTYILHVGRATLAAIAGADERTNRYHAWAVEHQQPHFGLHPRGRALAAAFEAAFSEATADQSGEAVIQTLLAAKQVAIAIDSGTPDESSRQHLPTEY